MSNYKMKSLRQGLRYISQLFENEKEPEMIIGTPTDVKHLAHIGWDGGSVNQNSPSWMNNFKALDASCIFEDSTRSRDTPGLQRSSRDRTTTLYLPTKERSRRGSSISSGNPKSSRRSKESSDIPLDGYSKSRRRKNKDSVNSGSSRSSRRARGTQTESS